ncbi:hypothetical protein AND_002288 [Anopheles darlingi]|uniref:Uncharacterized protein n=1 Tax=Anopheles darlingi TaxID=43151 RepID=W5JSQ9_ANODA|nr:hypothetical protein AND_002288 [Anopheles darlingi]
MNEEEDSDATIPATPEETRENDVEVVAETPGDDSVLVVNATHSASVIELSSDEDTSIVVGENRASRRRRSQRPNQSPVAFVDLSNIPTPGPALDARQRHRRSIRVRPFDLGQNESELENRLPRVVLIPEPAAVVDLSNILIPGPAQDAYQQRVRQERGRSQQQHPQQQQQHSQQQQQQHSQMQQQHSQQQQQQHVPRLL